MTLPLDLILRFGVSIFIGFLVGLQREYSHGGENRELIAGARTFSLVSLLGCIAAYSVDMLHSPWIFAVLLLIVGGMVISAYVTTATKGGLGQTTEVSILITLMLGAICYWGEVALAVALAVGMTVLLSVKQETQRFIKHLTREDIFTTLKFAVITAIILPVLPNQSFGPYPLNVLNPYVIWLMVVLISGVSFLGYVLIKTIGPRWGIRMTGLLGGLVSSTAVTVSFAQRSRREPDYSHAFALAIVMAWTFMYIRIVVVVGALNLALLRALWLPLLIMAIPGVIYSIYLYRDRRDTRSEVLFSNPFSLGMAIRFGIFFAIVLLIVRAASVYFGDSGVYISGVLAGVANLDAIMVSMANLSLPTGSLSVETAGKTILLASLSNTLFKGAIVLVNGSRDLHKLIIPGLIIFVFTAILVLWL